jgi:hypothetical protein
MTPRQEHSAMTGICRLPCYPPSRARQAASAGRDGGGDLPPFHDLADRRQQRAGRVDACGGLAAGLVTDAMPGE